MTFEEIKNVFKNDGIEKALEQLHDDSFLKRLDEPEEFDHATRSLTIKEVIQDYRARGISPACIFLDMRLFASLSVYPNTEVIVNQNDPSTAIVCGVICRAHPDVTEGTVWVF